MQIQRRTFFSSLTAAFAGCFGLISAAKASPHTEPLDDLFYLECEPNSRTAIGEWLDPQCEKNDIVIWIGRNMLGEPKEFWCIPPRCVRAIPSRTQYAGAYEVREVFRKGHPVILPATEFHVVRGPFTDNQRCQILGELQCGPLTTCPSMEYGEIAWRIPNERFSVDEVTHHVKFAAFPL